MSIDSPQLNDHANDAHRQAAERGRYPAVKVRSDSRAISIADENTLEPGAVREWILSADQIKLVTSAQAEIRQVLLNVQGGLATEITALLAGIDSHLNSDLPSATAVRKDLTAIAHRLRTETPEIDLLTAEHIDRQIENVLESLGTNLQREMS